MKTMNRTQWNRHDLKLRNINAEISRAKGEIEQRSGTTGDFGWSQRRCATLRETIAKLSKEADEIREQMPAEPPPHDRESLGHGPITEEENRRTLEGGLVRG